MKKKYKQPIIEIFTFEDDFDIISTSDSIRRQDGSFNDESYIG